MSVVPAPSPFTKDNPYPAALLENRLLTGPGSGKETRHFVLSLAGSGLGYEPGDSLGVWPANEPERVDEIVQLLAATGDETVTLGNGERLTLREALATRLSLALPTRKTLEALVQRTTNLAERSRLQALLEPAAREEMMAFLRDREFIDLLAEFPGARLAPQEFVAQLRRLVPRLYSIASAQRAHPDEVHLTVAVVRYTSNGRKRQGVCSTYLADRVTVGRDLVRIFVTHSHFKLPADPATDVIMVGPGTGVAPFRAFLEERAATRATGRNWLFFGDQHRATDFLYESDFAAWRRSGVLTRLDTAFSRDQAHKIYVQDRMREQGADLWRWLEGGASFYVCGDAKRMAPDVDRALHEIVVQHGGRDEAAAADFVRALRKEKRYQRDVY
jgi:sulfite reductase (NADPH) flavoprotein alpha-component